MRGLTMIEQKPANFPTENDVKALIRLLLWAEGQAEDLNELDVQNSIKSARQKLQRNRCLTEFDVLN
jgi:hypothetical protein